MNDKSTKQSKHELEIFERVLDRQIVIGDDIRLDIKVSVASLEQVEAMGLDLMSLITMPVPDASLEAGHPDGPTT